MSDGVNHIDCHCLECEGKSIESLAAENAQLRFAIAEARQRIRDLINYLDKRQ